MGREGKAGDEAGALGADPAGAPRRHRAGRWCRLLAPLLGLLLSGPAAARDTDFAAWLEGVRAQARAQGVSAATLDSALDGLAPDPRVIELDRNQPELHLTLEEYLARVVPPARIERGRARLARHRALLEAVGREFGVQPRFIVALWGIETDFGRNTGGFSVLGALATLAYDGRRSAFFRSELLDALRILDEGHIADSAMTGSWAGAMGQSQFMPSSFRRYAVDRDGDGRRDIWTSLPDVFASIANYLARHGWRADQTWGREVRLPPAFDRTLLGLDVVRRIDAWQALGVRRPGGGRLPERPLPASLVQPDGPGGRVFMVYENFRTTLAWNRSTYFAIAVGTLADAVGGR